LGAYNTFIILYHNNLLISGSTIHFYKGVKMVLVLKPNSNDDAFSII